MKKDKILRALNIAKNLICWAIVAVLVFSLAVFFASRINGTAPSVFGYSIFRVTSGSMEPELMVGDVILDKSDVDIESIKKGDIITYISEDLGGKAVTHRVIKAPYEEDGVWMLQTQGIANDTADKPISADKVCGIMVCKIPFLNTVYNIFLSPWGLLIIIGLVILIFFDEIIVIVRIVTNNTKTKKDSENINDIIARIQSQSYEGKNEKNKKDNEMTEEIGEASKSDEDCCSDEK